MSRLCLMLSLVLAAGTSLPAADWRQFRGNDATGVVDDQTVPTSWTETENRAWAAELPGRGLSGPIIVGKKVFLTASSGFSQDRLHVLCLDADTGAKLWHRQFTAMGRTMCHNKMCVATPTPCSDGKRVFAFFSSNDVICLDLEGNLQWLRALTLDYPNASNSLGMSSSPLVLGNTLVLQVENDSESFACGLDVDTGLNRWKHDRPVAANWTSPSIFSKAGSSDDDQLVLLQSSRGLTAIRPYSGTTVWNYGTGCSTIPSTVAVKETVYVPSNGLTALTPEEGASAPKVKWNVGRLGPGTPSPIVVGDYVYVVNNAGVLNGANIQTGEATIQLRLPGSGAFSSTPIAANGNIYLFREGGMGIVVQGGDKPKVESSFDLKETILCTPAIADGGLYVRSDQHLWKIAK